MAMMRLIGLNHRTAPVALREQLAWPTADMPNFLKKIDAELGCEAVLLSTCNRLELYLAARPTSEPPPTHDVLALLAAARELRELPPDDCWYTRDALEALRHLFRVSAGLDSLVLGEAQIAGQVLAAYELAAKTGTVGPYLHAGFQHARQVAKRVRRETGLTAGKISVPSLAIDYLRQVFDRFDNKIALVIGAGKMGAVALRHLRTLGLGTILVANRSSDRAAAIAAAVGGRHLSWEQLDVGLGQAHIVLTTTGAPEPILTVARFNSVRKLRHGRHLVILDLAVPRDVEPAVADFEEVDLLVNIDDLQQVRAEVLRERERHLPAAEAIVADELDRFQKEWARRWAGPAIAALSADCDAIRHAVEAQCLARLNGKLSEQDKQVISGALRLLQNKLLHAPIAALQEEVRQGRGGLLEALVKLFRLKT
jgi:glutamyl-tRNA reductase